MKKLLLAVMAVLVVASASLASAELDELRKHMRSKVDEVEGIKWIEDKSTPQYIHGKMCYVYLGQKEQRIWPRFVLGFQKDGWIFFQNIIFNIDEKREELTLNYFDVSRDHSQGIIWEKIDLYGIDHLGLIRRIVNSKKTLIRFSGKQYHYDFEVSKKQKDAIKRVIRLYELMR